MERLLFDRMRPLDSARSAWKLRASRAVTCTTAPPAVQSFSIERAVMTSNIETYLRHQPFGGLFSPVSRREPWRCREQLIYNPQANTLASTVFLVRPGSPIPTPSTVDITSMTLANYTIIDRPTYTSCSPYPSVMFTGTITSSSGGACRSEWHLQSDIQWNAGHVFRSATPLDNPPYDQQRRYACSLASRSPIPRAGTGR